MAKQIPFKLQRSRFVEGAIVLRMPKGKRGVLGGVGGLSVEKISGKWGWSLVIGLSGRADTLRQAIREARAAYAESMGLAAPKQSAA